MANQIAEYNRQVVVTLPHPVDSPDPAKYYARWNGGFVEVTDELIAKMMCPADLRGEPCEHDKLALCQKIRLCRMLEKHSSQICFDEATCPHVHSEIDVSCRYVARAGERSTTRCKQVLEKHRLCPAGHDFEEARRAAWSAYASHQIEGRALAAGRWVRSGEFQGRFT